MQLSSVQFSHSVLFNSLRPHGLQHATLPCPSPTLGACWDSCPSSRWCHPTILSSVIPLSSCLQSFPESASLPMSQFFTSDGQNIGVLASASVLPIHIQDWFPLGLTQILLICKSNQRYHTSELHCRFVLSVFLPKKEPLFLMVTSWLKFFSPVGSNSCVLWG